MSYNTFGTDEGNEARDSAVADDRAGMLRTAGHGAAEIRGRVNQAEYRQRLSLRFSNRARWRVCRHRHGGPDWIASRHWDAQAKLRPIKFGSCSELCSKSVFNSAPIRKRGTCRCTNLSLTAIARKFQQSKTVKPGQRAHLPAGHRRRRVRAACLSDYLRVCRHWPVGRSERSAGRFIPGKKAGGRANRMSHHIRQTARPATLPGTVYPLPKTV